MALPVAMGIPPTNPYPLGKSIVNPGTAVQLVHNFTDLDTRLCHYMHIQAPSSNGGTVYVLVAPPKQTGFAGTWTLPGGGTTTGADTVNFLNVLQQLDPGASWDVPSWMMNQLFMGQFWVDGLQGGDIVISAAGEA